MSKVSISLGQMQIKLARVEDNLETAERMIAEAAESQSQLIVLPELWSTGYDLENASDYADELGAGMFAQLAKNSARAVDSGLRLDSRATRRSIHELRRLL